MAAYEEIIFLSILPKKEVYTIEYSCPIKGRGQSKHCPRPFLIRQLSSAFATTFWQVLNELEQEDCWHPIRSSMVHPKAFDNFKSVSALALLMSLFRCSYI